jgi:quercetin dioxygenase-like cupin family protein
MIVGPGDGRQLTAGSTRPTVKVGPHLGSRLLGLLESELPPGAGFPGHVHEEYEEIFYVLEGEIEYLIGDEWATAPQGSTVFVPAGTAHGFRNPSQTTSRHLAIASPADAMTMIEELTRAGPDDLASVMARYRTRPAGSP